MLNERLASTVSCEGVPNRPDIGGRNHADTAQTRQCAAAIRTGNDTPCRAVPMLDERLTDTVQGEG